MIELSFLSGGKMGIWVLLGDTGELLCSKVVSSTGLAGSRVLSIQQTLAEARKSMGVRGRDAMCEARDALCARTRQTTDLLHASHSTREAVSSVRGLVSREDLAIETAWPIARCHQWSHGFSHTACLRKENT